MKRIVLGLTLLFGLSAVAQQAAPPSDIDIPSNLKPYYIVFYVTNANSAKSHENPELMKKHLEFVRGLSESRRIALAGPFTDNGKIGGMFILSAKSAEDARNVVSNDPIVSSHSVDVEVHSAMLPDLSPLKIVYPPKKVQQPK